MSRGCDAQLSAAAELWTRSESVGRVAVQGESMSPLIRGGDTVRVRGEARPRLGDIVVARVADSLVVHRLVRRSGGRLVLRGDSVPGSDPPLPPSAILGVVTAVESRHGPWRRLDHPSARAIALATTLLGRSSAGRTDARPDAPDRAIAPKTGDSIRTSRTADRRIGWMAPRRAPRPARLPATVLSVEGRVLAPMSPEEAFVLLACRRDAAPETAARALDLAARGLDWDLVIERAVLGQLGPLLYVGAQRLGAGDRLPESARSRMRALYVANWARSRRLESLLEQVLAALAPEGIDVLAHKGAALVHAVYDDPALHISGDLDLCVRDAGRERAWSLTRAVRGPLVAADPDRRKPDGVHIEIDGTAHHDLDVSLHGSGHWRAESFDWTGMWDRATPVVVGEHRLLVPCPDDFVLTLVANAVRRGFTPVRLVFDMAATIDHFGSAIDWRSVQSTLVRTRLDRRSWIALGFAAEWFGAAVPAALLEPPPHLRLQAHEQAILAIKQRRPFWRTPTRILWSGDPASAAVVALRLTARTVRSRIRARVR